MTGSKADFHWYSIKYTYSPHSVPHGLLGTGQLEPDQTKQKTDHHLFHKFGRVYGSRFSELETSNC